MNKQTAESFKVEIVSPEQQIFRGMVNSLAVTGIMGELEILKGHAPLLTQLAPGTVWLKQQNEQHGFALHGGILEVQPSMTIVLADVCIRAEEIDAERAQKAIEASNAAIAAGGDVDYAKVREDLNFAVAQLRLLRKVATLRK